MSAAAYLFSSSSFSPGISTCTQSYLVEVVKFLGINEGHPQVSRTSFEVFDEFKAAVTILIGRPHQLYYKTHIMLYSNECID